MSEKKATDCEENIAIVQSEYFDISMMRMSLAVLSIPHRAVTKCAWWLFREFGNCSTQEGGSSSSSSSSQKGFGSFLVDDDGLSLICNEKEVLALRYLLQPEEFTKSPFFWKAFIIRVGKSAVEVPGVVYSLASSLSNQGLSILHISTFESEIFLIQEPDLEKACKILKEFEDPVRIQEMLDNVYQRFPSGRERMSSVDNTTEVHNNHEKNSSSHHDNHNHNNNHTNNLSSSGASRVRFNQSTSTDDHSLGGGGRGGYEPEIEITPSLDPNEETDEDRINLDLSWITPQIKSTLSLHTQLYSDTQLSALPSKTKFDEGFSLCVLPVSAIIAKCPKSQMRVYSDVMVRYIFLIDT
jgi:hypothetical protein